MKVGFVKTDIFSRVMRGSAKCLTWMNCWYDGVGKVDADLSGLFCGRYCKQFWTKGYGASQSRDVDSNNTEYPYS